MISPQVSHFGALSVSSSEMTDAAPTDLSSDALALLLGEALRVGVNSAPPEVPEWWNDPAFPYVVVSYVGRGGSGFVWKAGRRDGHGLVALKLVPFRTDPVRLQQRWQDECAALAKIRHPNLVALIDHGRSPDGLSGWLAMEWIEGTCLSRKLQENGRIPCKEVVSMVPQIVAGLSALHQAGLIHRDIKPSNLLSESETGRIVVADLGTSLDLAADADQRVTRTFEQPLTPGYFPPELLQPGYVPTALGDQYSLAFTLWQLLSGTMPIGAFAKLHQLCKCPDGLDAVLRKALATNPAKRFPNLAAFGDSFRNAASRPSRRGLIGCLICLLALAATIFWINRPPTFPKRFHSGKIPVNEGRQQFVVIDLTIRETGDFLAKIRTTSLDPFFGFDGKTDMVFRDAKGNIIHQVATGSHGVNGRLIPGGRHDRTDTWHYRIPADAARRVATIDFHATPSANGMEHRLKMNQGRVRRDLEEIKTGAAKGLDALYKTVNPPPAKPPEE
jgi:serine/threonine protein kinase